MHPPPSLVPGSTGSKSTDKAEEVRWRRGTATAEESGRRVCGHQGGWFCRRRRLPPSTILAMVAPTPSSAISTKAAPMDPKVAPVRGSTPVPGK